jgi:hypothetical protein
MNDHVLASHDASADRLLQAKRQQAAEVPPGGPAQKRLPLGGPQVVPALVEAADRQATKTPMRWFSIR